MSRRPQKRVRSLRLKGVVRSDVSLEEEPFVLGKVHFPELRKKVFTGLTLPSPVHLKYLLIRNKVFSSAPHI